MLLNTDLATCLDNIEESAVLLDETIVPASFEPVAHSPYRPGYDWLFLMERRLARVLAPWLEAYRHELIGAGGILSEALSNAYCHGHGRDGLKSICIRIYAGVHGVMVRIADSGEGFDLKALYERYRQGKGYFSQAGNGFSQMVTSQRFGVFFNDRGNAFHMVYLFNRPLSSLSGNGGAPEDSSGTAPREAPSSPPHGPAALCPPDPIRQPPPPGEHRHIPPPADTAWAEFAVLLDTKLRPVVFYGMDPQNAAGLAESVAKIVGAADRLSRKLTAGTPSDVNIRTAEGALIFSRKFNHSYVLLAFVHEEANPSLASHYLPQLFTYLESTLAV